MEYDCSSLWYTGKRNIYKEFIPCVLTRPHLHEGWITHFPTNTVWTGELELGMRQQVPEQREKTQLEKIRAGLNVFVIISMYSQIITVQIKLIFKI